MGFHFACLLVLASVLTVNADLIDGACYDYRSHLLDAVLTTSGTNTPHQCIVRCFYRGYSYAGVKRGYSCYCGNNEPPASKIRDSSQCNVKCSGSTKTKCGGNWTMNIYRTKTGKALILTEHRCTPEWNCGDLTAITRPTPWFGDIKDFWTGTNFNDIVSTVSAQKGNWELYTHINYEGDRMVVREGQGFVPAVHNDQYSSARPICQYEDDPSTAKLKIYEHVSLQGESKEILNEVKNLHEAGNWGDKVSSVHAIKGDWELYEHINYVGKRETVKEGESKNVANDIYSSLRPICETYSPKCKPIRIEIIGTGNKRYVGTQILGPSSAFSCSGPATSTLRLNDVDSLTESISVGFSESKEINWSVGLSVSLSYGSAVTVAPVEVRNSITITASTNYGESYTVLHSETKTVATGSQQLVGKSVTYDTPGGAIVFGTVQKYTIDNTNVPVEVHVECNGKPKIIKSTMNLRNTYYKSAHFGHFNKKATVDNCKKSGYYSKVDMCIQNVKAKYHNKIGEKEEIRKKFYDCFIE